MQNLISKNTIIKNFLSHKIIDEYYNNPNNPGSFSGISSLYKSLKKKYPKSKLSDLNKWGETNAVYTRHFPIRKKITRNCRWNKWHFTNGYLRSIAKENEGYQYILTVIDVFT